ncbi:MarR family transcriptional regulator (plasmid) [Thioclava litoralis]|uniref:MarR family transcriptional regulator n=1 Tax=Thioclava litoralis TaxID=3076557 RepID=A0ABZ1E603_9RHOB|nr:MarR family transcriptional regulator [Thioclava sp. FTW29]
MTSLPPLSRILSDNAAQLGLSRPAAMCLGAIWRAAQNPSADDLVTLLGISRSNVSTALKELREIGLVQQARSPGSRKDFYVADADPWALLRKLMIERQRKTFEPLAEAFAAHATEDPRLPALAEISSQLNIWLRQLTALDPDSLAKAIAADPTKLLKKKKKKD